MLRINSELLGERQFQEDCNYVIDDDDYKRDLLVQHDGSGHFEPHYKVNDVRIEVYRDKILKLFDCMSNLIDLRKACNYYITYYPEATKLGSRPCGYTLTIDKYHIRTAKELIEFYDEHFESMIDEHNANVMKLQELYEKWDKFTCMDLTVFKISKPSKSKSAAKGGYNPPKA